MKYTTGAPAQAGVKQPDEEPLGFVQLDALEPPPLKQLQPTAGSPAGSAEPATDGAIVTNAGSAESNTTVDTPRTPALMMAGSVDVDHVPPDVRARLAAATPVPYPPPAPTPRDGFGRKQAPT